MAGPISGLPTLGSGAASIPVLGAGGLGNLPAIGLPRAIGRRSAPSSFDPLGVFSYRAGPHLRHIDFHDFTNLVMQGREDEARARYIDAAMAHGIDHNRANEAALAAITSRKQDLSGSHFVSELANEGINSEAGQAAISTYAQQLMSRGMDQTTAWAAAQTAAARAQQNIHHATSTLDAIGEVLSIPSHIVANWFKGYHEYKPSGSIWDGIEAMWAGTEKAATTNPISKYGMEDLLTEVAKDNNYPWLKNRVVQFSISTLTDPISYLSLGATAPAKIAASRLLAVGYDQSSKEAIALLSGKGSRDILKTLGLERTPMKIGTEVRHVIHNADGDSVNFDELTNMIHMAANRPVTLGDALTDLRREGLARKEQQLFHPLKQFQARRATQGPIAAGVGTAGRMLTGAVLPFNVKGGRGLRFGGLEVPGTPALGAGIGRSVRGAIAGRAVAESRPAEAGAEAALFGAGEASRIPLVRGLAGAFVPRWRAGVVADDIDRSLANLKLNEFRFRSSSVESEAGAKASKLAQVSEAADRIPPEARRGLLQQSGPAGSQELHLMKMNVLGEVKRIKSSGEKAGFKENSFDRLWKQMVDKHDDPLNALAEFKFRAESSILSRTFIEELLSDPRFARRLFGTRTDENFSPFAVYGDHADIPEGYVPFHWQNKTYAVKTTIRDALDDFAKTTPQDRSVDDFLKLLKVPQNFWKVYATTPNPSFHVMNFLGAVWNNLYAGVYNPIDYLNAIATLYNSRMEEFAQQGRRAATRAFQAPKSTARTRAAREVVSSAEHRGGLGRQSIFQELTTGKKFARLPGEQTVRQRGKEIIFRHPEESKKRYAFRQTRRGIGVGAIATANPVVAAAAFAPELAGAGRTLGSAIENTVRLAPYMKHARDPDVIKLLEKYGPIRIPGLTHPGFTKQQQSAMYDIGAAVSTHFQFDYGDLTTFERKWAKTFFPFWVFYKNNFILQAATVATRPRFVNTALQVQNFIADFGTQLGPEQDLLPDYFRQLDAFQIPVPDAVRKRLGLGKGPLFLNPKLPFVSLNLFPPLWEIAKNNGMTTAQRFGLLFQSTMGSVGPWAPMPVPGAKIMLEAWVNTQLGLNQKIDFQRANSNDTRDTFVDAPGWVKYMPEEVRNFFGAIPLIKSVNPFANTIEITPGHYKMTATSRYVLEQMSTPFITNLGRSAQLVEPGTSGSKGSADMVSWISGLRLIPADTLNIHRQWAYKMRDMFQAERARLKKQGKDLSNTDLYTYHEVLQNIKSLEAAYKQRETEMYGTTP